METTIIDRGNLDFFTSFLLPDAALLLKEGKPIFALGLVENEEACGALAGGPRDGYFEISSFFIAPVKRGKGGGKLLLESLKSCMEGQSSLYGIRSDFTVTSGELSMYEDFLRHSGFEFKKPRETIYSVNLSSLSNSPFFSKAPGGLRVHQFLEIPTSCIRELDRSVRVSDEAILPLPLDKAELDPELSVAVMDGSRIDGFMVFDRSINGQLTLAYADSGAGGSAAFSSMLSASYQKALAKYPKDTEIIINCVNAISISLLERLAPEGRPLSRSAFFLTSREN